MRVLLTGGTGLIGSRVAEELHQQGHEVTELRRYVAGRSKLSPPWQVVHYDLRGGGTVPQAHYDVVFHLAAMASNAVANLNPTEAFDIIATGTQRLISDVQRTGGDPWFVLASSSEVYATPGERRALNPYAAAKIAAEEAVKASGFRYTIMRPFNTYGRALIGTPVAVVDKWVVAALRGDTIRTGDATHMQTVRDFLWREDHVRGYLLLLDSLDKLPAGQTYEMGTAVRVRLADVLQQVRSRYDTIEELGFTRPGDVPVLLATPERFMPMWAPEYTFEQGMEQCIKEWRARLGC